MADMNSSEARNHFILNHYHRLMRISKICARRIQKIFPMVSVDDLQGFAFEGMIVALDKADLDSETVFGYTYRYALNFTLNGAFQMLGIRRKKENSQSPNNNTVMISFAPKDISDFIEGKQKQQSIHYDEYEPIFNNQEVEWLLSIMDNSQEQLILFDVLNQRKLSEMAEKHHISIRQLRRLIAKIRLIYLRAQRGLPINSLLTPVRTQNAHLHVSHSHFNQNCYYDHQASMDQPTET